MSKLTIYGFNEAMLNNDIELRRTLEKLATMSHGDGEVVLSCGPRRDSGFLEWLAGFYSNGICVFTLGCIQRSRGAEMEFHS